MPHQDRRFDPAKCARLLAPERWQRFNPPALLALAGVQVGQVVLDLGCGPGFWTFPIAQIVGPAGHVIALDASCDLLSALADRKPPSHVRTVQAELPSIGLPPASVDFIWAAFVFHEVDPPVSLAQAMFQALRPGGRLAVLDWRPDASGSGGPPRQDRIQSVQVCQYLMAAEFAASREIWRDADAYLITAQRGEATTPIISSDAKE